MKVERWDTSEGWRQRQAQVTLEEEGKNCGWLSAGWLKQRAKDGWQGYKGKNTGKHAWEGGEGGVVAGGG